MAYKAETSGIKIAFKNDVTKDILQASGTFGIAGLDQKTTRYFLCYPKKRP
jgi:hypothetical protein